ncbi:MAG: MurR/RpiR family transcriptional regulator, partial [Solobacterium sp.]|nr:MurR/RpiR family transcriptional regulator [Solobacterium sp.]
MIDFNLSERVLSSLNQKELDLLKFIYLNSTAISCQTIQQFSNNVHVSSSSILRFCKKIGFSGFSELKYNIRT